MPRTEGNNDHRIVAGVSWQEVGESQLIVATLTRWWLLTGTGFVDITGDDQVFSSDPNVPVRLLQFGNATSVVPGTGAPITGMAGYGVNGISQNLLTRWIVGRAVSDAVVGAAPKDFLLTATGIAFVGERLGVLCTPE